MNTKKASDFGLLLIFSNMENKLVSFKDVGKNWELVGKHLLALFIFKKF